MSLPATLRCFTVCLGLRDAVLVLSHGAQVQPTSCSSILHTAALKAAVAFPCPVALMMVLFMAITLARCCCAAGASLVIGPFVFLVYTRMCASKERTGRWGALPPTHTSMVSV
jgi:hypothetical protein